MHYRTMFSFSTNVLLHWLLLAPIAFSLGNVVTIAAFASPHISPSSAAIAAEGDEGEEGGSHRRGTGVERDAI